MALATHALVIGNSAYSGKFRLVSPLLDANAVAQGMTDLRIQVTLGIDLTFDEMTKIINSFLSQIESTNVSTSILYFSGHGLQINDTNFMVPVDFDQAKGHGILQLIGIQDILDKMSAFTDVRIVLLDACRSNLDARTVAQAKNLKVCAGAHKTFFLDGNVMLQSGLAEMRTLSNTFIAFAASPGDVAYDGPTGSALSPFTASLVSYLDSVDLPISNLTSRVRQDVLTQTMNRQWTWDQSSLMFPFYFNPGSLLLLTGNALSFVSFVLSFAIYSLVLFDPTSTASQILAALLLPALSFLTLAFGVQRAYSRLRGHYARYENSLGRHIQQSFEKGMIGGFIGSAFAALVFAVTYYHSWPDPEVSIGNFMTEVSLSASFAACPLGVLSCFFARIRFGARRISFSHENGWPARLIGCTIGGACAGLIAAPWITLFFGLKSRPLMTPDYLMPGSILGVPIIIFSIVSFDFERLSARRLLSAATAAIAAATCGFATYYILFSLLGGIGVVTLVEEWMRSNGRDASVLLLGGAFYGLPVGIVLGSIFGLATIIVEIVSKRHLIL